METNIIAFGGSIVIPGDTYDENALIQLLDIIKKHSNRRFVFIIGGGRLCRNINDVASKYLDNALLDDQDSKNNALDELGIAATKINARYVIKWLTEKLDSSIVLQEYLDNPELVPSTEARVVVASGFRPGVTTDFCMMKFAEKFNAAKALKISNFKIVLNVEPDKFDVTLLDTYEALPKLTWNGILDLVGETFIPGGNYPLDPPSAKLGKSLVSKNANFSLYIGEKEQLDKMLEDEEFVGTIVRN
jgi:uridylate kinase